MAKLANPILGFKFKGNTDKSGGVTIGFSKISSLKEESEIVEYREGDELITVRKLVGLSSVDNVTLERGVDREGALLFWRYQVAKIIDFDGTGSKPAGEDQGNTTFAGDGSGVPDDQTAEDTEASSLPIVAYERNFYITAGSKGKDIKGVNPTSGGSVGWVLWKSWPTSYEEGEFDAQASDVVFSTVELAHRGIGRTETPNTGNG